MDLKLSEPVVAALLDRLSTQLAPKISELNAGTGVDVEVPKAIYDFVPGKTRLDGGGYPAIGIQDLTSELVDGNFTGEHSLGVLIYLAEAEEDVLARKMRRYVRAVSSVVIEGHALPPAAYGLRLGRINYGPTLNTEENPRPWVTWARIPFVALSDER